MAENNAAWLPEKLCGFKIGPSVRGKPSDSQILVRTHALAINPIDAYVKHVGVIVEKYPTLLGFDTAGEVVEVGAGVSHFKIGDRVLGFPHGCLRDPVEAGFQEYVVIDALTAAKIPDSLSYAAASAIPLGAATAAIGIFGKDYLAMDNEKAPGKAVLIWGAASSVGACAVQFASGLGYRVFAVASAVNHQKILSLGAEKVFDYHDESVIDDIVTALEGITVVGGYSTVLPEEAVTNTAKVLLRTTGGKFVASAGYPPAVLPEGSTAKFIDFKSPYGDEDVRSALALLFKLVETGLASGKFVAYPPPLVVGTGLEAVSEAVDVRFKGVSACKVVVELP